MGDQCHAIETPLQFGCLYTSSTNLGHAQPNRRGMRWDIMSSFTLGLTEMRVCCLSSLNSFDNSLALAADMRKQCCCQAPSIKINVASVVPKLMLHACALHADTNRTAAVMLIARTGCSVTFPRALRSPHGSFWRARSDLFAAICVDTVWTVVYICMHACMYECMYACIHAYTHKIRHLFPNQFWSY